MKGTHTKLQGLPAVRLVPLNWPNLQSSASIISDASEDRNTGRSLILTRLSITLALLHWEFGA